MSNLRQQSFNSRLLNVRISILPLCALLAATALPTVRSDEPKTAEWKYAPELLVPFWDGETMRGESILFIKDSKTGTASGSLLFPVKKILSVQNSTGDVTYEEGRDYTYEPGSRRIEIPAGSRIASRTPQELRRPAKTQKYELTHRDGNGEIFFGSKLEYHDVQTCFTYTHAPNLWKVNVPKFDETKLPNTIRKLRERHPLKMILLGDSISAGCNASGWAGEAPYQPPFPKLVEQHLSQQYGSKVSVQNLSVGGKDTAWAVTVADEIVAAEPDVVILAFGMNDSSGRPAKEYQSLIQQTMTKIKAKRPATEFILVASMLGNKDWVRLHQELFPEYRDALQKLCEPGVALADMTSQWAGFFEFKKDWDLTGNGVNHPNDFGHRVYAQMISALLVPEKP